MTRLCTARDFHWKWKQFKLWKLKQLNKIQLVWKPHQQFNINKFHKKNQRIVFPCRMQNFINLTWKTKPAFFPTYRNPVICNSRTQQKHLFSCLVFKKKQNHTALRVQKESGFTLSYFQVKVLLQVLINNV